MNYPEALVRIAEISGDAYKYKVFMETLAITITVPLGILCLLVGVYFIMKDITK